MHQKMFPAALGLSLLAALAGGNALAQTQIQTQTRAQPQPTQQEQARVTSTTQVTGPDGRVGYDVSYEYNGRQYRTHTERHPGATIPIEVRPYGVATMAVAPQAAMEESDEDDGPAPWEHAVPEPGMVVSGGAAPAPRYYAPPMYAAPAYAAPVYVQPAYGYGYAAPYAYPPIGLSLNLGYSRGWGGHGGRWR